MNSCELVDKEDALAKNKGMSRVTSKLQVTLPKRVADRYGIKPGDDILFIPSGDGIRVVTEPPPAIGVVERLRSFDEATVRQHRRQHRSPKAAARTRSRGWAREDLYDRARPR